MGARERGRLGRRLGPLDAVQNDLPGMVRVAPADQLDPLAGLQVLVMREEMLDLVQGDLRKVAIVGDVVVAPGEFGRRHRDQLFVTAGLVLQNPPALRNLILTRFGWWNLWLLATPIALQIPSDLDSPTNAAKVTAPAIFVLADADTLVVPANSLKTVNAYAGPKRIIHYAGGHNHGVSGASERELDAGFDWLLAPR